MTTETTVAVNGIPVDLVRKDIRNLHLGVYPPDGRVRVAAPPTISDAAVRALVASRLPWIRQQQASFRRQARESAREMVSGETHWFGGRRYRLRVIESEQRAHVRLDGSFMELRCPPGASSSVRAAILDRWYRSALRELVPSILSSWAAALGIDVPALGLRYMRTKWGSWSPTARRVWLNVELAKKPRRCLDYVVLHELLHGIERHHDSRFHDLLDEHMPHWRMTRAELAELPLAHYPWPD